jgi:hypothetical protein
MTCIHIPVDFDNPTDQDLSSSAVSVAPLKDYRMGSEPVFVGG